MDDCSGSNSRVNMLLPQGALAYPNAVSVTYVWIRRYRWREEPATAENGYQAVVIRYPDRIIYKARGATVSITEHEAEQVVRNPFRYYFSTALKLHFRIERELQR